MALHRRFRPVFKKYAPRGTARFAKPLQGPFSLVAKHPQKHKNRPEIGRFSHFNPGAEMHLFSLFSASKSPEKWLYDAICRKKQLFAGSFGSRSHSSCSFTAAGAYFLSDKKIPPRVVMVPAPEDPFATGEEALDAALEKARDDLEKLEVLNARIPAAALSAQISRMEKAGAAILQQVREHPEKGRDIRKFVTYYLPTAVKILTTYADLSASGAGGENAKSLMSDVEKNAGTIAAAFEAQLDALFAGEVLDVSSDIAVLDGMLSGDGLSGKNNLKLS